MRLSRRYKDAYRAANVISGFGTFIKWVGFGLVAAIAAAITSQDPRFWVVGFFLALLVGALFFLLGVVVSALGQILMPSLDTAVNTSPLMGDEDKARVMSLP